MGCSQGSLLAPAEIVSLLRAHISPPVPRINHSRTRQLRQQDGHETGGVGGGDESSRWLGSSLAAAALGSWPGWTHGGDSTGSCPHVMRAGGSEAGSHRYGTQFDEPLPRHPSGSCASAQGAGTAGTAGWKEGWQKCVGEEQPGLQPTGGGACKMEQKKLGQPWGTEPARAGWAYAPPDTGTVSGVPGRWARPLPGSLVQCQGWK